jgi:V/A-type H+/Na+-transporting ATPase subunit I
MIVDVVKYFILGTRKSLNLFFEKSQDVGFLEFISVSNKKPKETSAIVQSLLFSIKLLGKQPKKNRCGVKSSGSLSPMEIANRALEIQENLTKLYEEKKTLGIEIARISPFGDFSIEDIRFIEKKGGRRVQFFCMKTTKTHEIGFSENVIYISVEQDLDYFIAISNDFISPPNMIEIKIDISLSDLQARLDFVVNSIHLLESELKEMSHYVDFLQDYLCQQLDIYHLNAAKTQVSYPPITEAVFLIEAWVPCNKVALLYKFTEEMDVYIEEILTEKKDKIPTCMQNKNLGYLGEDLVKIYDIPAVTDKDPSSWVLGFFAFFFAIIVGDGGYGLIFLLLALYLYKKFPNIGVIEKRMLKLLTLLSIACIGWGVVTSSYFGLKFSPKNPIMKISPLQYLVTKKADYHFSKKDGVYDTWIATYPSIAQAKNGFEMLMHTEVKKKTITSYAMVEEFSGNIILEFTILIGIIHISFGFLRYLKRHYAAIGWIVFMVGGYFLSASVLKATLVFEFLFDFSKSSLTTFGKECFWVGLGFALIAAVIQHRWKGLGEIANTIQIFSDVLSYLRLYALSLAGAIMASTFNQEGSALGFVLGFIIILIGHAINMTLSFLGGIIHGLRLNFLEWYHYCFDGGGRLFKPLRKTSDNTK